MITTVKIIEAIAALAAKEVPELKWIYADAVPKNFERPSLLIQSITSDNHAANAGLIDTTEYFTLTVYDRVDDYDDSCTKALIALRDKITRLFRPGFLRVEDRALHAEASSGGRDWDKAFIDLQFSFFEVRDDAPDNTPLMGTIDTKVIADRSD